MLVQILIRLVILHCIISLPWYGYISVWNILNVFNRKELLCRQQISIYVKWSIVLCLIQILYIVKFSPLFSLCPLYYAVCRKCIYKKLNDEDLNHCPVCNIDLGCTPVDKLRYFSPDPSLYATVVSNWNFSSMTNVLLC